MKNTIFFYLISYSFTTTFNDQQVFSNEGLLKESISSHLEETITEGCDSLYSKLEVCYVSKLIFYDEELLKNLYFIKKVFTLSKIEDVKISLLYNYPLDYDSISTTMEEIDFVKRLFQEMLIENETNPRSTCLKSNIDVEENVSIFQDGFFICKKINDVISALKKRNHLANFGKLENFVFLHDKSVNKSIITTIIREYYRKNICLHYNDHNLWLKIREYFYLWYETDFELIYSNSYKKINEINYSLLFNKLNYLISIIQSSDSGQLTDNSFFYIVAEITNTPKDDKVEFKESMIQTIDFIFSKYIRAKTNKIIFFSFLNEENNQAYKIILKTIISTINYDYFIKNMNFYDKKIQHSLNEQVIVPEKGTIVAQNNPKMHELSSMKDNSTDKDTSHNLTEFRPKMPNQCESKNLKNVETVLSNEKFLKNIINQKSYLFNRLRFFDFKAYIENIQSPVIDGYKRKIFCEIISLDNSVIDTFSVLHAERTDFSFTIKSVFIDLKIEIKPMRFSKNLIVELLYFNQIKTRLVFRTDNKEIFDQKLKALLAYCKGPFESNQLFFSNECEPKIVLYSMIKQLLKTYKCFGESVKINNINIWNDDVFFSAIIRCMNSLRCHFIDNNIEISDIYLYENTYHGFSLDNISDEFTCFPIKLIHATDFNTFFHPMSVKREAIYQSNVIFNVKNFKNEKFWLWIQFHYHNDKLFMYIKEVCKSLQEKFSEYANNICKIYKVTLLQSLRIRYSKIFTNPSIFVKISKLSQKSDFSHSHYKEILTLILNERKNDFYKVIFSLSKTESTTEDIPRNFFDLENVVNYLIEHTLIIFPDSSSYTRNTLTIDIYSKKHDDDDDCFIHESFFCIFFKIFTRMNERLNNSEKNKINK
ncbi:hypothetical protein EDEG_03001 [Edhazardia aedis USNM 41457]|uniref:Uncharacterized protein n=1 Tax=Edhazardia aedis (strain USNM 41457) TaxID=1003232 RepID=J9D501_EDHAE|nr:hypothetical protein EDEG_03001 [Edhazardia aedis USNM 41457]|eukprot:EJW02604.1 hypothetical protein EDEG_03001 [Edhazardia aedis USNM 41457]